MLAVSRPLSAQALVYVRSLSLYLQADPLLGPTAAYDASVHKRAEAPPVVEKRGLLGGALGGVLGGVGSAGSTIISGVTGAVGDLVNGLASFGATNVGGGNVFPDAAHPFQAPGSTE